MGENKKIFFYLKSYFRERQWDTLQNIPKGFEAVYLKKEKLKGSVTTFIKSSNFLGKLKTKFSLYIPLCNVKKLPPIANECDFIYTWGYLPLGAKKPFVIEMDNPYCLTYYNYKAFLKYKNILKKFLKKAYKLTFMSEASMFNFLNEFNGDFKDKCVVLYPFAKRRYNLTTMEEDLAKRKNNTNFLFVGLDFRRKGGRELLEAFSETNFPNIRLYIVSFVSKEIKETFKKDKRIVFLEPMPRDKLLKDIYPKMHIFIFPTLHESFGVVLLEALSFGLGLIATNVYAMPELLHNGENGVLLHHPFLKPENLYGKKIVNPVKYHLYEFSNLYLKNDFFYYSLYAELKEAIKQAVEEYPKWRKKSVEIFEEKFSEDRWIDRFKRIFVK